MALLDVQNLRTVFHTGGGTVRAVDGVSFSVERKRTLGIVGESGCGKSVSALSVMRLVPNPPGEIEGGQVIWKGEDLLKRPLEGMTAIRGNEIAMIFQNPMTSLNPVFTIRKQLFEVLKLRFGLKGEEAEGRAAEMLSHVGIADPGDRLGAYPHELSGGMKQRIIIAMALMAKPDLLIADEPTTALDVTIQAQILKLIRDLQHEMDMAVVLITHDMGVVAQTCDDVVVMYAGKVAESAGVFELFENNRHPYTRGLLRSIPRQGATKENPLPVIEGTVPSLVNPPKGCRFAERCFRRMERTEAEQRQCWDEDPTLAEFAEGHRLACHYPLERPAE